MLSQLHTERNQVESYLCYVRQKALVAPCEA